MNRLCLALCSLLIFAISVQASQVVVSGDGLVKANADLAYVTVGVEQIAKTASEAQAKVSEKIGNVLASLKKIGLTDEKLATTNLGLRPNYDYKSRQRSVTGYTATNQIRVTVDKIAQVGGIIDTATQAGATNIHGISFTVKDHKPLKQAALAQAVKTAKTKAEVIADAAGLVIEKIASIQEAGTKVIPQTRNMMALNAEAGAMAETPVLPGKIEVRGNVTVVYDCKAK